MFSLRNAGGVSLFLLGTTYLWLTPAFASKGVATGGKLWSVALVFALVTLLGFTVATWGLFVAAGWWETVAVMSAVAGTIGVVPYWIAAQASGEVRPWYNAGIHLAANAGVFLLLLVPVLEKWVSRHVIAGR